MRATPGLTISCSLGGHTGRWLIVASCIGLLILDVFPPRCFNARAPIVDVVKIDVRGSMTRKRVWEGCRDMPGVNARLIPEARMRTELERSDLSKLIHGIQGRLSGAKMSIVLTIRCSPSDRRLVLDTFAPTGS